MIGQIVEGEFLTVCPFWDSKQASKILLLPNCLSFDHALIESCSILRASNPRLGPFPCAMLATKGWPKDPSLFLQCLQERVFYRKEIELRENLNMLNQNLSVP
jgi:hypothetical protein